MLRPSHLLSSPRPRTLSLPFLSLCPLWRSLPRPGQGGQSVPVFSPARRCNRHEDSLLLATSHSSLATFPHELSIRQRMLILLAPAHAGSEQRESKDLSSSEPPTVYCKLAPSNSPVFFHFPTRTDFRTDPSLLYPLSPLSITRRTEKTPGGGGYPPRISLESQNETHQLPIFF
jgi:hypothetical protein